MIYDITLPYDMLWTDNDPADFWADETEQFFIAQFCRLLYQAGYEAKVVFGYVNSMQVEDEDGDVDDERIEEIRAILDRVQPEYIELEYIEPEYIETEADDIQDEA